MKKLKIGFGEGGFQGFMARHIEKCVLVAVILLMGWFIYSGVGAKALDSSITREKLKQNAQEAETKITNSRWDAVEPERKPGTDVFEIIKNQTAKIDSRNYAYKILDQPLVPRLMPRLDPKLIAAEKVIVTPLYGPLALNPPEGDEDAVIVDPLDAFPVVLGGTGGMGYSGSGGSNAEGSDSKDKGKKPRDSKAGPMGASSEGPTAGGPMGSSKGKKPKKGEDLYGSGSQSYSGSMGGAFGSAAKQRMISPEAMVGIKAAQGALLQPRRAMVITAVVPFSKQWAEYQTAFKDAPGGQDPTRDIPEYIAVWVEVLDVTDDPAMDSATAKGWKRLKASDLAKVEVEYATEVRELADEDAIDPKLTHPVPPFLLTDLQPVLLHPDVPKATNTLEKFEGPEEIDAEITDDGGEIIKDPGTGTNNSGGSKGYPGMQGGSRGKQGGPRPGGFGSGMSSEGSRGMSSGGSRGMSGGSRGMGSGSGGGMIDLETYRPVAKKLVRFVDFDAQPGRKYRYRVQLVLNDPNHPEDSSIAPDITTLNETARERVKALDVAEAKSGKRKYWVTTPMSEPSDIVWMPNSERFYAGETIPASTINIAGATIATNEPVAKVLTVTWDPKLGVFAPAEQSAHRGSVLNIKGDVEVLHPVLGDLRKIEGYDLRTEGVVLDISGGDKLPGTADSKETIRAPGETLLMDANGNFVVTDESRDIEGYRRYIFPEPKEEAPPKESASSGSSISDSMSPPGYPGSGKPGKSGKGSESSPYDPYAPKGKGKGKGKGP